MGFDSGRTGTPDGTNGLQIAMQSSQADANEKLPVGINASDMIANGPTAHRSAVASADSATDLSSAGFGTSTKLSDNRGAITLWADFNTSGASLTARVAFYDNAATPAPLCIGPLFTLSATARRLSAAGNYVSEPVMIDTRGFPRFKVFIETISAGTVNVFAEPV